MSRILLVCATWALLASAAPQTLLHSSGETFTLANIPYYAPPTPVSQLSADALQEIARQLGSHATAKGYAPISVIPTAESDFTDGDLDSTVQIWKTRDDVWSEAFLHGMSEQSHSQCLCLWFIIGLYIAHNGSQGTPSFSLTEATQNRYAIQFLLHSSNQSANAALTNEIPAGPYLLDLSSGRVHNGECLVFEIWPKLIGLYSVSALQR